MTQQNLCPSLSLASKIARLSNNICFSRPPNLANVHAMYFLLLAYYEDIYRAARTISFYQYPTLIPPTCSNLSSQDICPSFSLASKIVLRFAQWISVSASKIGKEHRDVCSVSGLRGYISRCERPPFFSICIFNISTFCSKFDSANRYLLFYLVFEISQQATHFFCHQSLYGRHGCLFCLWLFISISSHCEPGRFSISGLDIFTFCSKLTQNTSMSFLFSGLQNLSIGDSLSLPLKTAGTSGCVFCL